MAICDVHIKNTLFNLWKYPSTVRSTLLADVHISSGWWWYSLSLWKWWITFNSLRNYWKLKPDKCGLNLKWSILVRQTEIGMYPFQYFWVTILVLMARQESVFLGVQVSLHPDRSLCTRFSSTQKSSSLLPYCSPSGKSKQIRRPYAYGILACRCLSASLLNLPNLLNLLSFATIPWLYINPPSHTRCLHWGIRQTVHLLICWLATPWSTLFTRN